jgi:hypothetical protein
MNEENLGWQILEKIEQNRDWRRQHRREWLAEIADDLWSTMPDDEALDDFRLRLKGVPWWASDVVECLEYVIREEPDWAAPTLVQASGRGPWLGPGPDNRPDVYLAWLAEQIQPMRAALDQAREG